jgi:hypothetical protein
MDALGEAAQMRHGPLATNMKETRPRDTMPARRFFPLNPRGVADRKGVQVFVCTHIAPDVKAVRC